MKIVLPALVLIVCSSSACSSTTAACEKAISCDPDTNESSPEEQAEVDSCVEYQDSFLAGLRASSDAACRDLADAFDAQNVCYARLECDELNAPTDDTCKDERDVIDAACDAVGGTDCQQRVTLACGLRSEP